MAVSSPGLLFTVKGKELFVSLVWIHGGPLCSAKRKAKYTEAGSQPLKGAIHCSAGDMDGDEGQEF